MRVKWEVSVEFTPVKPLLVHSFAWHLASTLHVNHQVIWLENVPYEADAASVVAYIQGALEVTLPHIIKARDKTETLLEKFQLVDAEWQDAQKQVRVTSLLR